jgi:hypothetical protein
VTIMIGYVHLYIYVYTCIYIYIYMYIHICIPIRSFNDWFVAVLTTYVLQYGHWKFNVRTFDFFISFFDWDFSCDSIHACVYKYIYMYMY